MRSTTRTARLLALTAAGALALTACGDDGDDNGTGGDNQAEGACESFTSLPEPEAGTKIEPPENLSKSDGVLKIGSLLPQTGSLAFLGPPEFAGVELAVKEVNDAGGVLGKPIEYIEGDSGDATQDVANPTTDRLLAANVDVIIGAASSGVSKTVIDKITSAGVVHYSPANTDPEFTTYEDKGLYFRTAPSDVLQGRVLGETIVGDGYSRVAILARQDDYGTGLQANVGRTICDEGGDVPIQTVFYPEGQDNFEPQVGQIKAADPEAIVLIGFDESTTVIQEMIEQGVGPQDVPLYTVDGNTSNTLAFDPETEAPTLPEGVLEGVRGTAPGAEATGDFRERLATIDPNLKDFLYAAESYDAVITSALAALAAESDAGVEIAKNLVEVTRNGEKCTTFQECKELLEAGEDIDYDGISGPIEFSDVGDPTQAFVGVYTFNADNKYNSEEGEFIEGSLEE